jgi:hypothetical protein
MLAVRLLNTIGHLVRFGDATIISIGRPAGDLAELAARIAAAVPLAWTPCDCGGALHLRIAVVGGKTVGAAVHRLDKPPGWREVSEAEREAQWLEAGHRLSTLAAAELQGADAGVNARPASGSN